MICVHYDKITGKILGAFDSKMDSIPTPNIKVTEEYWSELDGKEKKVDLKTLAVVGVESTQSVTTDVDELRRQAYVKEADPLFFKWQRKECTKSDWTNKIKEIKKRYPKSTD